LLSKIYKYFIILFILVILNNNAFAISGHDISNKISDWLETEGISGEPIFSKSRIFNKCDTDLKISKLFSTYSTVRVQCNSNDILDLVVRVKLEETSKKVSNRDHSQTKNRVNDQKVLKIQKKQKPAKKIYKAFILKTGLEKNSVLQKDNIKILFSDKISQTSFFGSRDELIGRKLKKNLKMGQLLHPRHLYEKFDINQGDFISIVSNVGNTYVTVSGEAEEDGNLGDIIKVTNLRSGKTIKGYVKKNKIIKIFR